MTPHIAVLCDYRLMPDRVGGMDLFFVRFDAACRKRGIAVDWFFPNAATHNGYDHLRIHACPDGIENGFLETLGTKNYTHIITHFVELCTPFHRKVAAMSKAKLICVDHNPRPPEGYPLRKRLEKRLKGLLFSRHIDAFVGVSDYTVREMVGDFGRHIRSKCRTVYNGIDLDAIPTREGHRVPPRFLVASHLRPSKGIQDLIAASALLPDELRRELRVDIYGEGPQEALLKAQIAAHGLQAQLILKGSSPELKRLYGRYDYLLQPTYMECFSLSILESLAADVPVVTTPVGGTPEVVAHGVNGLLFPAGDVEALAGILMRLLRGETVLENATRPLIQSRFSLETMVENHLKLLD